MSQYPVHFKFPGRLVMVGFGSIGQGVLPLILRHIAVPPALRSNYALREQALALRDQLKGGPTAVLTHGANPGLVSHFVKQALLNVAADTSVDAGNPKSREEWAALAAKL